MGSFEKDMRDKDAGDAAERTGPARPDQCRRAPSPKPQNIACDGYAQREIKERWPMRQGRQTPGQFLSPRMGRMVGIGGCRPLPSNRPFLAPDSRSASDGRR